MFGFRSKTTKFDVIMSVAAAIVAVWKASDSIQQFKAEQAEKEQNK